MSRLEALEREPTAEDIALATRIAKLSPEDRAILSEAVASYVQGGTSDG